jgi:parallel beta-helix repeat protein
MADYQQKLNELLLVISIIGISFVFVQSVNAEENFNLSPEFQLTGIIEGENTHFEINNSKYLNVVLDSSEKIKLRMESMPEMITMIIEPVSINQTNQTQITISNLPQSTTLYKYQDDYHNLTEFTTDANGVYSYFQDISQPHFVFIQPRKSTKFIKDNSAGGDCYLIGNWNSSTKTCTLTKDLNETIQIDNNNITLDGNNHTITGTGTGSGVYFYGKDIIVKNLIINNFTFGIYFYTYFYFSNNNNFINENIVSNNHYGIRFRNADNNIITKNIISNNYIGVDFFDSYRINLINNIFNINNTGVNVVGGNNNIAIDNTINSSKNIGIFIISSNNKFNNNIISNSNYDGVYLYSGSNNNVIINNIIDSSGRYGIFIYYANNNKIYSNNFINNLIQSFIYNSSNNIFNLDLPIGGNYWSNFDVLAEGCNDLNNDKICDSPYVFTGGQDNLPWKIQDGWNIPQNQPPTISNFNQYKSDGVTVINEGNITTEDAIVFKANLNDPDNDQVKLELEYKPFNQTFDGQNTTSTFFITSGNAASIAISNLDDGQYRWRARAVDDKGNASEWKEFGIAGNADFEVKLVPLYTQVESDYPSLIETQRWSKPTDLYGSGNYIDCIDSQSRSTIRRCGCAITSMVMLGRYYGINTGIDNTNVDPGTINAWLTNNSGYTKKGSLRWGKSIEYLGFIENSIKKVRLSLDYHNATSTFSIVDNYITSAKPAIAYSGRFGHYFVIDDKLQNTYTLKDPRWYNTKKLNDPENLANEIRGYSNYFDTANLFSYLEIPKKLSASIYFYLSSPAELLVTDPQGRKLGNDPILNITYNEIPESSYTQEGLIITSDTPLYSSQIHKTKVIYIPTPIDGNYDIQVIGTDTGSYELNTFTYDNQGESHTQTQTGNTQTDLSIDYNLNFTPDQPENISIQPEDTEAPTISHTQLQTEYLLNSSPIIFNFSAQDGTGVFKLFATLNGQPISDGTTINFNQVGEHTIIIEAEDFIGNKRTESITYKVIYDFSGFLPPIKTDGSGLYKLGRTLPTKFQLKDANGQYISIATAQLFVAKISNGVVGSDEVAFSTSNADTGNVFRYDAINNQYIYNLSTDTLSVGSWQLKVVLDDGNYYAVIISIK